ASSSEILPSRIGFTSLPISILPHSMLSISSSRNFALRFSATILKPVSAGLRFLLPDLPDLPDVPLGTATVTLSFLDIDDKTTVNFQASKAGSLRSAVNNLNEAKSLVAAASTPTRRGIHQRSRGTTPPTAETPRRR